MKKKQLKACVTGSNGFIGKHLVKRLKTEGFDVVAVPREFLLSYEQLKSFMVRQKPDFVFHLAAYGNHSNQQAQGDIVITNVIGTHNALMSVKDIKNLKLFVNFGSSSEYGVTHKAMNEEDMLSPRTYYAATKAAATHLTQAFWHTFSQPVVTVRPFSVYGQGEADFRFIPTVVRCIEQREPLNLLPDQEHDWIYIDDFIDGIMSIVYSGDLFFGDTINIGTGIATTNAEIVNTLVRIAGKPGLKVAVNNPISMKESDCWVADNTQLRKRFQWKQKHTLEQGLTKTYEYYAKQYSK